MTPLVSPAKSRSVRPFAFYQWLLLALVALLLLSPLIYWATGIGQAAAGLSPEIGRAADGSLTNSPKAEALHALSLPMRLQRLALYPLLLLAFQLSGGAVALRALIERRLDRWSPGWNWPPWLARLTRLIPARWRQRLTGHDLLVVLLFIVLFDLALFLLYLPFNFYRGFILTHQFGLSAYTALGWLSDWGKNVGLALLMDGLLWGGFYSLVRLLPRRWPILGGALLVAAGFGFTLLSPILITPLFYEVRPMEDPALRSRLITMAERTGMTIANVEVIDASRKTTTVNAYVTSVGGAQRMVLYDTLLDGYTPDQIEVVVAHELGHWYYQHVLWSVIGLGAGGWLGLFALRWLLNRLWRPLGWRGPADVANWPTLLAVMAIVSTLALPVENAISRYAENQADAFALSLSQKPDTFISLFEQFAVQNLSLVDPPAWEKVIFYTHPPTNERIQRAKNFQIQQ